jgi:hypothetical protein
MCRKGEMLVLGLPISFSGWSLGPKTLGCLGSTRDIVVEESRAFDVDSVPRVVTYQVTEHGAHLTKNNGAD